jgi:archaellum component FlaC
MITELNAITELKTAADALKSQYENVTSAAKDMVSQIQQVIQNEREQAASYAETGHAY